MLELGALAVLVAGASYGYSLYLKGRAHARFKAAFEDIARKLGGKTSPGTIFDAPELRLTVGGTPVLLRLRGIEHPDRGVAIAEAPLGEESERLRLYVGWDVSTVPRGLEHIPEIALPRSGYEGRLVLRSSEPSLAIRFVEKAAADLQDMRREARAHAIEVLVRGGTLLLAVHGIRDSAATLERVAYAAIAMKGVLLRPPPPPERPKEAAAPPQAPSETVHCALCGDEKKGDESWVRCSRCAAPYHKRCFTQATGCVEKDCHETRALAFDTAPR